MRPSPAGYNFTKISSLCISALQMVLPLQHAKDSEMPTAAMAKARRPLLEAARGVGLTAARRHLRTSAGGHAEAHRPVLGLTRRRWKGCEKREHASLMDFFELARSGSSTNILFLEPLRSLYSPTKCT
jgi:hypothetical protein